MDKKSKIALYIIVFVILMMMVAEVTKPKAITWRDSYSAADKIPLGCFVLFNELKNDKGQEFKVSRSSVFDFLKRNETENNSTLIFINNNIYFGDEEAEAVLNFVDKGNSVFISTSYLHGLVADTLNVEIEHDYDNFYKKPSNQNFISPSLKDNERLFEDVVENGHFIRIDTIRTTILGTTSDEDGEVREANFIKTDFGENGGKFYLHSNPFAFSNYHMLDDKEDYAASVLSYLPNNIYIWDNYYKAGRRIITSPLRFVLTNTALKWAFYILMFSLLIFVIFKGKRTQRIIPVVKPLENSTVEFTQTIGDLYFQTGSYSNIIDKKIKYFLEYVRSRFYLNTQELNEHFITKLSQKSSNSKEEIKKLVDLIVYLKSKNSHTEDELKLLNQSIESFKKNHI